MDEEHCRALRIVALSSSVFHLLDWPVFDEASLADDPDPDMVVVADAYIWAKVEMPADVMQELKDFHANMGDSFWKDILQERLQQLATAQI
jgi:hypothetical protein